MPDEAITLAVDLVVDGAEAEDVVALAGLGRNDHGAAALELMARVLEQERVPVPSWEEGAFRLGLDEVWAIAVGARDPIEGARWIWTEVWSYFRFDEFSPFVAMVDDLDGASPEETKAMAQEIVDRAEQMIGMWI